MKKIVLFTFILLTTFHAFALGEWTDYSSHSSATKVILTSEKVYCVTTGGLFTYDRHDNSLQKITGINGLSDVGIHTAGYGEESEMIIIAYENSNLDLISGNEIYNLSAIKRKQIPADKTINNILFVGQTAYLSCGFGIVAVNLDKREIKDTYYIGDNGAYLAVNDMAFDGQFLYAATENGIYKADINSSNLQDYNNWNKDNSIPFSDEEFDQLEFFNNTLIASHREGNGNNELFILENSTWSNFPTSYDKIRDISVSSGILNITYENEINFYNSSLTLVEEISTYKFESYTANNISPQSVSIDEQGNIWIADSKNSLVEISGNNATSIKPKGPTDNNVFALSSNGRDIWLSSGGRSAVWNNIYINAQFQLLRDGKWKPFNGNTISEMGNLHDIVCVTADPNDPDHVFAASWGAGVFEFQDGEFVARYNNFNSSLQTALPESPEDPYVRISDLKFDSDGNLWVTNSLVGKPISVFTKNREWQSFALDDVTSDLDVGQMVITADNDQWIVLPRGHDLAVRKEDGSADMRLDLIAYFTNGTDQRTTSMNDIYSIAIDDKGAIWFGTSVGVGVIYDPEDVWTSNPFYASQPGLNEGDGIYHPLLSSEVVTAIAIDGANRKWFGTKNSGVYLISEDGEEELAHFTSSNSPLFSNEITSIAINGKTGEVFFGTTKGLISYQGDATEGNSAFADVYAFPNPVRENYEGDIVISGLVDDTDVKITDISGNLVHETTSLGGQATWDGKNLHGNKVSTGVYIVFGNDPSGEKTFTTKILFIH